MMKNLYKLVTVALFLLPSLTATAQDNSATTEVIVFDKNTPVPSGVKKIASVKMGDGWRADCGYDRTLELVKEKAKERGGNAIRVTEVKTPDAWSTCYRIKADVFSVSHEEMATARGGKERYEDSLTRTLIPANAQYALLYFYRPPAFNGVAVQYNIHVNDEKVWRARHNDKAIVKLDKEGKTKIWARTESREELELDVEFGKVYFVRCAVKMGVMVGHPDFEMTNIAKGLGEFDKTDERGGNVGADDVYESNNGR